MDILHQSRAKYTNLKSALSQRDPFDALLSIGLNKLTGDRIATLRAGILDLERKGIFGKRVYSDEAENFVLATEA